jgi:hypothetical protein
MSHASLGKSKSDAHSFAISDTYCMRAERKFLRWNCHLMAIHHSANNFRLTESQLRIQTRPSRHLRAMGLASQLREIAGMASIA